MKRSVLSIVISIAVIACTTMANCCVGQSLPEKIALSDLSGKTISLFQKSAGSFTVIVFLLPDCPACQSYSKTLNQLASDYSKKNFTFYGVFPGTYNSLDEMLEFRESYKINFPLLRDPEKILVRQLKATTVPQAFVLNKNGEVVYSGRIDDWMYALGKKRSIITKYDLKNAMNELVANKAISNPVTVPIGCIIE